MERVVFFEAPSRPEARRLLRELLVALWEVSPDSIEYYNLDGENDLIANSMGGEETGDLRLFECGVACGQAMYTGGVGHPLMLLDRSLDRVMTAYLSLPHRGEAGLRKYLGKID
ncbi:hypothetical protein ACYSUW_14105 [Pseudomonas frederiksbergensis]